MRGIPERHRAQGRRKNMDENTLNLETRKFLKEVGVTTQRKIEQAVGEAVKTGKLQGNETLRAHMTVTVDQIELRHEVTAEIRLA
jgi:hypothetical protein